MSSVLELARPEIRELKAYQAAQYEPGLVRLNANETPWPAPGDESEPGLNRYPEPRPVTLTAALAKHYGLASDQVLVTRGSSEAIDLLMRGFCRAGTNEILICPPTFEMYRVYADIQGARVREIPLRENDFALDVTAVVDSWDSSSRLCFVCSPNNPTGNRVPTSDIAALCKGLANRGLVVLDGAYTEFAQQDPTLELLKRFDNIVVLRTLSKAFGLAGVRCGVLLGQPDIVELLACVLPPYSYPTPSKDAALAALAEGNRAQLEQRIAILKSERERMAEALEQLAGIERAWPSEANFVMIRAKDPEAAVTAARRGGLLIRDYSYNPKLAGCLRITVGDVEQNNQLLECLRNA